MLKYLFNNLSTTKFCSMALALLPHSVCWSKSICAVLRNNSKMRYIMIWHLWLNALIETSVTLCSTPTRTSIRRRLKSFTPCAFVC